MVNLAHIFLLMRVAQSSWIGGIFMKARQRCHFARLERRHIKLLLQIQDGIPFAVPAGRSNGTENVQCHRSGSRGCIAEGEWKILLVETPVI